MSELTLLELFPEYRPQENMTALVEHTQVCQAQINRRTRAIQLQVRFPDYISCCERKALQKELSQACQAVGVELEPRFPASCVDKLDMADLTAEIVSAYGPARAILNGCCWTLEGEQLHLRLKHNGKDEISPYLRYAEAYLQRCFGLTVHADVESGQELTAQELFEQTRSLRQEAVNSMPVPAASEEKKKAQQPVADTIYGKAFKEPPTPIEELNLDMVRVCVEGEVVAVDHTELTRRDAWVIKFDMTDFTSSIRVDSFMEKEKAAPIIEKVQVGMWLRVLGKMTFSKYENENVLQPLAIMVGQRPSRQDTAEEKRVELHLHTKMSAMDALTDTAEAVKQAAQWGHRAIAITDHGVVQSFPDAMKAGKKYGIKILYGCEAYYVNDVDDRIAVHGEDTNVSFDGEYVAFDLETTGLSARTDEIIEFGAVILRNGELGERFEAFVNPGRPLSQKIVDLTGITDEMLKDAPPLEEVLPKFLEFCGNRPLAAHNADFDVGFVRAGCERMGIAFDPTYVDSLIMAQNLLPELKKYKLDLVAQALKLPEFNHHRASDDAATVAYMLPPFFRMLEEQGVTELWQVNSKMAELRSGMKITDRQARHMILIVQNQTGLKNLYRLVSYAHLKYYKRVPRVPKSELIRYREGLLIGSACESGELFQAIVAGKDHNELRRIASFYDFLEIQPLCNNQFLLDEGTVQTQDQLRDFNRTVVALAKELDKPVVATGDVHFLRPEDEVYRRILLATKGYKDADRKLPLYFKTTDEMLEEFSYLGAETAQEVVVTWPNHIADLCGELRPVPTGLYAPKIENSAQQLKDLVYGRLHELYGENPPELITERVETELGDIIKCEYDVIYMIAQKLVAKSNEDGYLVGSRGSVGSSIVAYLSGITEVNSFPPHYRCPSCRYTTFDVPSDAACGADLPDAVCPQCGEKLAKEGFNIPFQTFLGFGGDKVPDIDLNFSGEYQARAHAYTVELFGIDHVFRAGTIGTVASKTAYGYVKKYLAERNRTVSRAEENRLTEGCVGVKRTTGQHPGGLVVVPADKEIYDFCPVQHPADDNGADWITTHFEYHAMEENLLKLDMLGHDDPTMVKMLEDLTGIKVKSLPLDDPDTMSIFTKSKVLGYEDDPILGPTGATALPEFGTSFTRGMLLDTQPTKFDTLLRISGFSHGTDVWLGNAKDLILGGTATAQEVIGCRDDIMLYLIRCGLPDKRSFKIMEAVRKGRGLPEGAEEEMVEHGVPTWYIESCKKIKYLFPKAHAVAYVMMAFRIAWFKVHRPLAFYAAWFSIRAVAFDAVIMTKGKQAVLDKMKEINEKEDATANEKDMVVTLEVCYEFYLRGYSFASMDLYRSDATHFLVDGNTLIPPFIAVAGLGETAARSIVETRQGRSFLSIDEFSTACGKVTKAHIEGLKQAGVFGNMPETSQVSLFELSGMD